MKRFLAILLITCVIATVSAQCTSSSTSSRATEDVAEVQAVQKDSKGKVIKITQKEFISKVFDFNNPEAVYTGKKPVIVDCYADWCGWCKKMDPAMNELAEEYDGQVIFYRIDMDAAKEMGRTLKISGLPTLLVIKPNTPAQQAVGYHEKKELKQMIDEYLLRQEPTQE